MIATPGILTEPEGAHIQIGDMLLDERHPERFLDQQAGEHQQRAAGHVEQREYSIGQNVVEARSPQLAGQTCRKAETTPSATIGFRSLGTAERGLKPIGRSLSAGFT